MFKIPKEHHHLPEVIELMRIDKEFAEFCEEESEAIFNNLWESDQERFDELEVKSIQLGKEWEKAINDYDTATGEPKPLGLDSDITSLIKLHFADNEQNEVAKKIGKTLAYIKRFRIAEFNKIAHRILQLAQGDLKALHRVADIAKTDYRDILIDE